MLIFYLLDFIIGKDRSNLKLKQYERYCYLTLMKNNLFWKKSLSNS
jgi:hypothetical protein